MDLYRLVRPVLFRADPEAAHRLAIAALKLGLAPGGGTLDAPQLAQRVFGLDFANPLGLAAGFDKDAEVADAALGLGFGFVEVGTITPRPQPGNPRPRVFRLAEDAALINRLGFNSAGHEPARARLAARGRRGIVGVNIGANKESRDRVGDYVAGVEAFHDVADYLSVNVSSPNTPGLRDLQAGASLEQLLDRLIAKRASLTRDGARPVPLLIKIAPDLSDRELAVIVEIAIEREVDGLIIANTTVMREGLKDAVQAREPGGLSGRPLFALSTRILARAYLLSEGSVPLIGVGGVASAADAMTKVRAGASLVQLYTAMVFEGPGLARRVVRELAERVDRERLGSIADAVGSDAEKLASIGL